MGGQINGKLDEIMKQSLNNTLQTIIASDAMGVLAGALPDEIKDAAQGLKQHVDVLAGSSLGKNIMSAGFDVEDMVKIASGSEDALHVFAEKNGVPLELLQIMIAFTRGSGDDVIVALRSLLERYQDKSPVPFEIATALAELAFKPSPQKTQKCVDVLFQHGVPMILSIYLKNQGSLQVGSLPALEEFERSLSEEQSRRAQVSGRVDVGSQDSDAGDREGKSHAASP